jgi:glutamate dehydrogenase (NAD(P)+)
MFCVREALKMKGKRFDEVTVAVQGFGNVGSIAAYLMAENGAKIVAVSDVSGGYANPKGLDMGAVRAWVHTHKTLEGFPGGDKITQAELLAFPCDVLAPCALENQLTAKTAPTVKAWLVAEGANGPTTPEADRILEDKGVILIPDILCNAGGVTVSYFEWVQGLQSFFWTEPEINARLERIMTEAFQAVMAQAEKYQVGRRVAAQTLAISRVAGAAALRGIYP